MNALDRFVGWLSPVRGVRRVQARAHLAVLERHYEAATKGKRLSGRLSAPGDANNAMRGKIAPSAEAARDLVRNNAWAAKGLACIVGNTIGAGITSEPRMRSKAKAKLLRDAWSGWAGSQSAHAAGQLDWYGIQALCLRAVAESGAVFVVRQIRNDPKAPLSLRVLEREYLDTSKGQQGIEYDADGKAKTYHLFTRHPNDVDTFGALESKPYSADHVVHLYRIDRPGQRDGITWFAPVVLELHDLDGYEDATLLKQKVAACYTGFITRANEATDPFATTATPITQALEPGGLEVLPAGANIAFSNPPTVAEYTPFVKQRLRRLAAGLGCSYEALTGDLSEVNYSSGRMGWAEFQRNIDSWLWQMFIPMLVERVATWFLQVATISGIDTTGAQWSHNPPRRTVVDPSKEYPAIRDAIRAGLMTLPEALRDFGKSFDVQLQEMRDTQAALDEAGLVIESDARQPVGKGITATPTEQPAPEVPA